MKGTVHIITKAHLISQTPSFYRFAYYGGSTPFQNYVQYGPDDPQQAGALGKGQSTATALQTFFTFFCYFTPMLGIYLMLFSRCNATY